MPENQISPVLTLLIYIFNIAMCINGILAIASLWQYFKSHNEKPWAILIPVYNIIVWLRILKKPVYLVFLIFIPFINIAFVLYLLHMVLREKKKPVWHIMYTILLGGFYLSGVLFKSKEQIVFIAIRSFSFLVIAVLFFILGFIFVNGISAISWEFITEAPRNEMTAGGILPAIIGTFLLMLGSIIISIPIGVITAIYLTEYANSPKVVKIIRLGINNLAGVPSVVFGLFGLGLFVVAFDFGVSLLSGSLTLGLLNLPVIIRSTEEALQVVPKSYREASLSLGATKWQTIHKVVLPNALPGILTGIMLSLGRAAGETAPIMFTAAAFYSPNLPQTIYQEVMALPYHIYVLATAGTHIEETRHLQYGTAIVLIFLVLLLNLTGMIMRYKFRKRLKGQ